MTEPDAADFALWSDDPAPADLLSFDAVAATVADALLDTALDPVALGLSGTWGSGKTTVLGLVRQELDERAQDGKGVLVIATEPWRYDPTTGAKESLIGEVLAALADEVEKSQTAVEGAKDTARKLVVRLTKRIDWARAIKLTAKTSLAFQIPSVNEIVDLVKPAEGDGGQVRGLEAFRAEFQALMASDALGHIQAVAVLVDDLDRCLPETVIESLEAIRLFLAVPKMSFVIAADEERVADAIRTRFSDTGAATETAEDDEEPAKLYLHKIVQTTIPLPALSRFDTQAFLLLLQLQQRLVGEQVERLIEQCAGIRRGGGDLDDLTGLDEIDLSEELAFASRLTPILYEKLRGNPRRIKRFLNDLRVRQSIASRRGINLKAAIVAKLMILEVLMPDAFDEILGWLAQGSMRDQLTKLEVSAGKPAEINTDEPKAEVDATSQKPKRSDTKAKVRATTSVPSNNGSEFSEPMLRWAKLPPTLASEDLSPYLFLAAAFAGTPLLDDSLPERLRDIAANLLSSSRADQRAVTDADLVALSRTEGEALLMHIGRTLRDQPSKQKTGVTGILRIERQHPELGPAAKKALVMLPGEEVTAGTPLLFVQGDSAVLFEVLEQWKRSASRQPVITALEEALGQRSTT